MAPAELLGFIGGGMGTVQALPQVRRIRRLGHGSGVSLSTWLLTFIVNGSWCGYGIWIGSPSVIVTNLMAGLLSGAVVLALVGGAFKAQYTLPALGLALVAVVQVLPPVVTTTVLVALTCSRVPQLVTSWRNRRSGAVSAVSMQTLIIGMVSAGFWAAWAVILHHPLVILTSAIGFLLSLGIMVLERSPMRVPATSA